MSRPGGWTGVRVDRQQGHDLGGEVDGGDALPQPGADLAPPRREPLLPGAPLLGRDPRVDRVELGGQHDHRAAQVPAEGVRVLGDVGGVGGAAQQQVPQEVALVLGLDGGDRLLAGDQQRGHRGGALQRLDVVRGEPGGQAHADQPGEVLPTGRDPQGAGLPARDRDAVDPHPLDAQPARRVDEVVLGQRPELVLRQRRRPLPPVGGGDRDAHVEHSPDLGRDPREVPALQRDPGQPGVQRVEPGQRLASRELRVPVLLRQQLLPPLRSEGGTS